MFGCVRRFDGNGDEPYGLCRLIQDYRISMFNTLMIISKHALTNLLGYLTTFAMKGRHVSACLGETIRRRANTTENGKQTGEQENLRADNWIAPRSI